MNVRCRLALSIDILKFIRVFDPPPPPPRGGGGPGREEGYFCLSPNSHPFDFFFATNYSLRLSHYLKAWKRQP